jgi:hypothetical protein
MVDAFLVRPLGVQLAFTVLADPMTDGILGERVSWRVLEAYELLAPGADDDEFHRSS